MSEEVKAQVPETVEVESAPAATESVEKVEEEQVEEQSKTTEEEQVKEFNPEDVLKQVEFYFSDSNLPKDKFLWRTVQSNSEGWVSIKTIASFNRMKKFRPIEAIVSALRESKFLVVSEDGELIKRQIPILPPKESEKQLRFQRSVYAKGFGEETENTQEELETWFGQYGKVNEVRLRRDEAKKFKESVFVEFEDLEDAKKFVDLNPKPTYNEKELLIMSKPAYVEMKAQNENFGGDNNKRKRKFNAFKQKKGGKRSRN